MSTLARALLQGDVRALSRAISLLERGHPDAVAVLQATAGRTGAAACIGVTGPTGAGKSTLIARLITLLRGQGRRVGVLAVDPTSPTTGGALLGDRIRMQDHTLDAHVYIRSMAARDATGGLAPAVLGAARLLDAAGYAPILIETTGTGQAEVGIAAAADTVVLLLVPEAGDAVQAMKAGLVETADILVMNKADRPGAREAAAALRAALDLAPQPGDAWTPPVLPVQAAAGHGVAEVWRAVEAHRAWQERTGALARRRAARRRYELLAALETALASRLRNALAHDPSLRALLARLEAGQGDPAVEAARLLADGARLASLLAAPQRPGPGPEERP